MPRPLRPRPILAALLRPALAAILLAAVAAPLLPVRGAAAAPGCAMCARRCCCRPVGDGEGCRLSRPCGSAESDAATTAGAPRPALLDAVLPDSAPPAGVAPLPAAPRDLPPAALDPPPVPPPRPTAAR